MLSEQTIVSTILPTIASEFNATQFEYTWVGVAYMLTQTALQPLYGKLSNLIGRKVRVCVWRAYQHNLPYTFVRPYCTRAC